MTANPPPPNRPPPPPPQRPPPPQGGGPPPGYQQPPPGYYQQAPQQEYQRVYRGAYGSYLNYPLGENDKILAGLCYLFGWIISVVCLVGIKPCSPWLRFHAIQALVMHIAMYGLYLVGIVLMYFIIGIIPLMVALAVIVYAAVIGILVLTGKDHRVPKLGDWVEERYI